MGESYTPPFGTLETIAATLHQELEALDQAREKALQLSRWLTRHAGQCIQALHRRDTKRAHEHWAQAQALAQEITALFRESHPDLYYAGYVQDALKEFAEASVVFYLLTEGRYPTPQFLDVPAAVYVRGLAESVGELRRQVLDALQDHQIDEAKTLLREMDAIYEVLIGMDYPDAVTGGLRRLTDIARALIERTRGELTMSLRLYRLQRILEGLDNQLSSPLATEP